MKFTTETIRWLFSCLIVFIFSCNSKTNYISAETAAADSVKLEAKVKNATGALKKFKEYIKTGDVVTRTGNDFTSQSLRSLNQRDKTFSHCGIASVENDTLFIYHALGGEWNPDQELKRESFESFSTPYDNTAAGVFRFSIPDEMKAGLIQTVQDLYHDKVKFDLDFDLKTDDKMYCAEFVYKSFLQASHNTVKFHHSFIKKFEFIGVDDIILDPLSTKIAVFNYRLY